MASAGNAGRPAWWESRWRIVVASLPRRPNSGQTEATGWSRPTAPSRTASRNASAAKGLATEKVITSVSEVHGEDPSRVPTEWSHSTTPSRTTATAPPGSWPEAASRSSTSDGWLLTAATLGSAQPPVGTFASSSASHATALGVGGHPPVAARAHRAAGADLGPVGQRRALELVGEEPLARRPRASAGSPAGRTPCAGRPGSPAATPPRRRRATRARPGTRSCWAVSRGGWTGRA